jgi:aryl-alcohol dehydrogenase-like predicted oxidoreductase
MQVSPICFGCMSFGDASRGNAWVLDEEAAQPFFRQAVEAGINFFDTANIYAAGTSEEITGRALKKYARREEIVLATKVRGPMRDGPNGSGLSRKNLMFEIDESLRRLGTDYVDLYQIHRYDDAVPIEETLEALHDIVKAGKARYIGASSMYAWQFATMLHTSDANGWTRFVTMQNHLNALYREEEREMLPLCGAEGVGVIPWSPLARGLLARPWDEATSRSETDQYSKILYNDSDRAVVDAVGKIADARGVPRAQVALAWLLAKPEVTAPIVGVTKQHHLDDAVGALDLALTEDEIAAIEEPYVPHAISGH